MPGEPPDAGLYFVFSGAGRSSPVPGPLLLTVQLYSFVSSLTVCIQIASGPDHWYGLTFRYWDAILASVTLNVISTALRKFAHPSRGPRAWPLKAISLCRILLKRAQTMSKPQQLGALRIAAGEYASFAPCHRTIIILLEPRAQPRF